jgi:hypothetical protein
MFRSGLVTRSGVLGAMLRQGIRINLIYMVFGVQSLELVCVPILYCVPRVACGQGGRIVVSVRLLIFLTECAKLLDYLSIGHHCVL